jgi:hypothetical protein
MKEENNFMRKRSSSKRSTHIDRTPTVKFPIVKCYIINFTIPEQEGKELAGSDEDFMHVLTQKEILGRGSNNSGVAIPPLNFVGSDSETKISTTAMPQFDEEYEHENIVINRKDEISKNNKYPSCIPSKGCIII